MGGTQVIQPEVTATLANADLSVSNTLQKVLLVGQKLAGGSAPDGVLVINIASAGAPENALFGEASMLAAMVRYFTGKTSGLQNPVSRTSPEPSAGSGPQTERFSIPIWPVFDRRNWNSMARTSGFTTTPTSHSRN